MNDLDKLAYEASQTFQKEWIKRSSSSLEFNHSGNQIKFPKQFYEKQLSNFTNSVSKNYSSKLLNHFKSLEPYLPFSSSPKGFGAAWNIRKDKNGVLTPSEALILENEGGRIVPMIDSNILKDNQKGMIGSPFSKTLLSGVRHSKGNYEDALGAVGDFSYEPPRYLESMLRYRWLEHITTQYNMPFFMFVTMWFKYEGLDGASHVSMICPVKITKINNKINDALSLQFITSKQALSVVDQVVSLSGIHDYEISIREPLNEQDANQYSYEFVKSSKRGRVLKQLAREIGLKCPGEGCKSSDFSKLDDKNIHFGHIVPQSWSTEFAFLLDRVNHPDNLYLSCNGCNVSQNHNFPNADVKKRIKQSGTIGDMLRKHSKEISKRLEN
jgi:hypothetical protein